MAAGQHRDSRRRGFDLYSRKENFQYRYAGPEAERRSHDESAREYKNFPTSGRKLDASDGRTKKESLRGFSSSNGFSDAPVSVLGINKKRTSTSEDRAELPPRKKGKFSPIIWDKKEKEVRISSKNRVTRTVGLSPPPILPSKPCTLVSEGSSDGPNSEGLPPTNLALGSEAVSGQAPEVCGLGSAAVSGLPATSAPWSLEDDDEKGIHVKKEECFLTRSISMSRWASDIDSPRVICQSYDGCVPKREEVIHHMDSNLVVESERSSPESGEFLGQSSEGVSCGSSVSDDGHFVGSASRDCSGNESFDDHPMGIDGKSGNDGDADQMASDSKDGIDSQQSEEPKLSVERDMNMLQGCRDVSEYEKLNRISEGTYGVVYRARDKKTGEIVALKKVKMGMEEGFPLSALREINILLSFRHPSVVDVKEVVMGDLDSIFMVMEYMEHDLKGVMEKMKYPFSTSEVKCLMLQLLEGVKYLHDNWVLHRDLKTSNLLLNNKGELKVCDLGMARQYGIPPKPYTELVVTLWYRAPELLLGTKQYSTAIDMWSVGCIMAEFLCKKPLFAGETEVKQLNKIFEVLGAPNESNWPGYSELPGPGARVNFKAKQPYSQLRKKFPAASFTGAPVLSESGFDLLSKLLTYDPERRISADDALDHDWFREVPLPKSKEFMPTFPPSIPRVG